MIIFNITIIILFVLGQSPGTNWSPTWGQSAEGWDADLPDEYRSTRARRLPPNGNRQETGSCLPGAVAPTFEKCVRMGEEAVQINHCWTG